MTKSLLLAPRNHLRKPLIKRLFLDLEVSFNVVSSWRVGYNINIDYRNIIKERAVICAAYKWHGEDKVHVLVWDKNQNDKELLARLVPIMNEADEIIGHKGDSFDIPWVRARLLYHNLPPLSPYIKTVDTLQWARRKFYFNSNRLDYLGQYLGVGRKVETEPGLWDKVVLANDRAALTRMVNYCKGDIALLEGVWAKLEPMMKPKIHVGVAAGNDKWSCASCGSTKVSVSKTRVTAAGTKQYQMVCAACGHYSTINEAAHTAYLEAKQP